MEFFKLSKIANVQVAKDGSHCLLYLQNEDNETLPIQASAAAILEIYNTIVHADATLNSITNGTAINKQTIKINITSASYILEPYKVHLSLHGESGLNILVPIHHDLLSGIMNEGAKILSSFRPVAPSTDTKQ